MSSNMPCLCDSIHPFKECCEPLLSGSCNAGTAEQLMRSRYSAFVTENKDYLLNTWHPQHRPNTLGFDKNAKWLGLNVKRTKLGKTSDDHGWVEFVARYKIAGKAERIEELSYFIKENDKWFYAHAESERWESLK